MNADPDALLDVDLDDLFDDSARVVAERISSGFFERWESGERHAALDTLCADLVTARRMMPAPAWKAIATKTRATLGHITNKDPLSGRCVEKPRGYAGDARTLDYIYLHRSVSDDVQLADDEGSFVMQYTTNSVACACVRTRRQALADAIDGAAVRVERPNVLSLACGHLREAELSRAVRERRVGRFLAVDQDPDSLQELATAYGGYGVETVKLGVGHLLKGARPASDLDLAYTAGLYDYLDESVAKATTAALFDMLRPGGRVLLANFHPALLDIGYMEACMDWWLIYRDEADMRGLFSDLPSAEVASVRVWTDRLGGVVYAEAVKA